MSRSAPVVVRPRTLLFLVALSTYPFAYAQRRSRLSLSVGRVAILAVACFSGLAGCEDDGLRPELEAKPIYGDLSGLFYDEMCHGIDRWTGSGLDYVEDRSRSIKIQMNTGNCAVLYLDGVERRGNLMIYPWRENERPVCVGLAEKLVRYQAHQRVIAKVDEICRK